MNRYTDEINSQLILFNLFLHFKIIPFQNRFFFSFFIYILHTKSEGGKQGERTECNDTETQECINLNGAEKYLNVR